MTWQLWRSAHRHTCKYFFSRFRMYSFQSSILFFLIILAYFMAASVGIWYDVPLHRTLILSVMYMTLTVLPAIYIKRMFEYPALRLIQLESAIATLTVRLNSIGATEVVLVRLGELIHVAKQLQNEDVRSEAQLEIWTSRYHNVVEVVYSQINMNISNCAAHAFISYPLLKPVYIRSSFNDQHGTMKALLGAYVSKLSTIIDGYYRNLAIDPVEIPCDFELAT